MIFWTLSKSLKVPLSQIFPASLSQKTCAQTAPAFSMMYER